LEATRLLHGLVGAAQGEYMSEMGGKVASGLLAGFITPNRGSLALGDGRGCTESVAFYLDEALARPRAGRSPLSSTLR